MENEHDFTQYLATARAEVAAGAPARTTAQTLERICELALADGHDEAEAGAIEEAARAWFAARYAGHDRALGIGRPRTKPGRGNNGGTRRHGRPEAQ